MSEAGIVASDSGSGTAPAVEKKEDIKIWFPEQEHILKKWAEVSKSYRWFHDKAHSKYKWQNFWFSIPVIVLSNLTGIANFAQNSIPDDNENKRYVPLGIGFINILAGIITTVYQFLKVAELVEAHRSSSLLYSKFSRDISVQLTLPHQQRKYNGKDYLNMKKDEFDRLLEQAPVIPNKIIEQYTNEFMISDNCENPVSCFAEPCSISACAYVENATCVSNYCGGCYSDYYDNNELIICGAPNGIIDLSGVDFGLCDMALGVGWVNNSCQYISGCDWIVDGVDYSDAFFNSMDECINASTLSSESDDVLLNKFSPIKVF